MVSLRKTGGDLVDDQMVTNNNRDENHEEDHTAAIPHLNGTTSESDEDVLPKQQIISCLASDGKRKKFSVTNYGDVATPIIEQQNVDRSYTNGKRNKFSATNNGGALTPTDPGNISQDFTHNKCSKLGAANYGDAVTSKDLSNDFRDKDDRENITNYSNAGSPSERSCEDRLSVSHVGVTTLDDDVFRPSIPCVHRTADECAVYIPELAQGEKKLRFTIEDDGTDKEQDKSSAYTLLTSYFGDVAKRGRLFAHRKVNRIIEKNGDLNVAFTNIHRRRLRYLADLFTTLIDLQWRYNLLLFALAFVSSWLLFTGVWLVISIIHGDTAHAGDDEWIPCVIGVHDFTTALLFSIETQHTIGYGTRAVTHACPAAIITVMIQSVFGVLIQCVMTGLFFAKLSRGKSRSETILFSRNAVICQHGGRLSLMLRLGDIRRRSQIVGASVHMLLLQRHQTDYGEDLPCHQRYLSVQTEYEDNFFFLAWPFKVVHTITEDSPLWGVSAESLLTEDIEIVVIMEGVIESTGMTTQVRTSYLPGEIMWGYRIAPLISYQSGSGTYKIDYGQFHGTIPVDMSECSAKELHRRRLAETRRGNQCDVAHRRVTLADRERENAALISCYV
ncbi:G protein-activated inward rectifier potassium channel 2 [Lamellibrachia satsuma]|nr:G protein-activated inward rectifier potassium channel 2 [Lamellibrachia satsuma]